MTEVNLPVSKLLALSDINVFIEYVHAARRRFSIFSIKV